MRPDFYPLCILLILLIENPWVAGGPEGAWVSRSPYKTTRPPLTEEWWLSQSAHFPPGGGHLGIFWVGMCRPGLQIGTPF